MDAEDVARIAESLRQAMNARPEDTRRALGEFGWRDLLADEPKVAVSTLFTLAGELLTPGSMVDAVLLQPANGASLADDARVVLPPPGTHVPLSRRVDGQTVAVEGVVQSGDGAIVVPCLDARGEHALVVCDPLPLRPGAPLDGTAGWARVSATTPILSFVSDWTAPHGDAGAAWGDMVAAGRRALAHELVGIGSTMLSMTVRHVRDRVQFHRPLGSFQAVKHQLADVHLCQEIAVLSADAAWEDCGPRSAALAKAAAIRFTRSARASCQQLLGGMGFTWEHDFHRYLRRALTLEPLLGGAPDLHRELGAAVRSGKVGQGLIAL
jgi:Acyl-CoA dehydrogenase, C-terminal domain